MNYFNFNNNGFNWGTVGKEKSSSSAVKVMPGGDIKAKDNFKPDGDLFNISFKKNGKGIISSSSYKI